MQDGPVKGVDQVLAVLQDQDDDFARLDSPAGIRAGETVGPRQQFAVRNRSIGLPGKLHDDRGLVRMGLVMRMKDV